jgi:C1A family cysteine protease
MQCQGGNAMEKLVPKKPATRRIKKYGWIPDLPDSRDLLFSAPIEVLTNLPPKIDLTPQCPPVYDQGQLGSCTANAIAGAIEFDRRKEGIQDWVPSRLFIYYNERVIEGTVGTDSGARIRDGMKSVATQGECDEKLWPYDINKFTIEPPPGVYTSAAQHPVVTYQRLVQDLGQLKGCLASGYPFVFGFTVYESFESAAVAQSGEAPMPQHGEKVLGGHAVAAVGYDDTQQRFICRNSWGEGWGKQGYFTLPYAYVTQRSLASDFWTARIVH